MSRPKWIKFAGVAGWSLVAVSFGVLALDFFRFVRVGYANYQLAMQPLDEPIQSRLEGVVVLTGDHTRIPKAFELMRVRGSDWLIISGAGRGISLTELVNQQGDSAGSIHAVWSKIILESNSASTLENGLETARIVHEKKPTSLILVTSDYHMPRAATIFRDLLPEVRLIERPVTSGMFGVWPYSPRIFRLLWMVGLEYWKFRLYLTKRSLDPHFPKSQLSE